MGEVNNDSAQSFPCTECPAGIMHPRLITYFTWLSGELITVPHFPAWVCDICGKREYDEKAVSWLTMILSPDAGKSTRRVRKPPLARTRNRSARITPDS